MTLLATIGSLLLALCGLPEAISAYKNKSCGLGWPMLLMWVLGEIFLIIFAVQTAQYVLLLNYVANVVFLVVMIYYKIWGIK
jgi:uncharacterized membrane protein HdeD (DUF308 family)